MGQLDWKPPPIVYKMNFLTLLDEFYCFMDILVCSPLMRIQISPLIKVFTAVYTLKWFLASMNYHVTFQSIIFTKSGIAYGTFEGFFSSNVQPMLWIIL